MKTDLKKRIESLYRTAKKALLPKTDEDPYVSISYSRDKICLSLQCGKSQLRTFIVWLKDAEMRKVSERSVADAEAFIASL